MSTKPFSHDGIIPAIECYSRCAYTSVGRSSLLKSRRAIWYVVYTILSSLLLILAIEIAVRVFYPKINLQGNQKSMFVENRFHNTVGLKPNSKGIFFGEEIHTDKHGFRKINSPEQYGKSWLFLGDSVTFGVGIEADRIFPQLIQNELERTKIWNSAVVGYSTQDYLNVTSALVPSHDDIEKVVLFFCLNDVYGNLSVNSAVSKKEVVLSFLRSNSKLYLLLKNTFFDRSKTYASHDIGLYQNPGPEIEQKLKNIVRIKAIADKSKIEFLVAILPYEYQLRVGGLTGPQNFLSGFFAKNNIDFLDMYEDFSMFDSKDYFLYGDPMHFSRLGHEVVARKMVEELQ